MNDIELFKNESFGEIRTLIIDNEVWFVGKDIAEALGYSNPQKAIRDHVDEEDKTLNELFTVNGTRGVLINESGLYSLILSSKLPQAKEFKRWVTNEVLPTLRKTGSYIVQPKTPIQNLEELKVKASRDRAKAMLLNAQNRMLKTLSKVVDNNKLSPIAVEVLGIKSIQEITGNKNLEQYLPQVPKTYSATEIGNILGVTANKIGSLAKSHNLKTEENGMWVMDKSKYSNKEVSTFRYFENAINVFRGLLD